MPRARRLAAAATGCLAVGLVLLGVLHAPPATTRRSPRTQASRGASRAANGAASDTQRVRATAEPSPRPRDTPTSNTATSDDEAALVSLAVTFESCVAGLPRDRHKRLRKIHWLHFPKCGTSLGTVVHGYLCQSEPSPHTHRRPGTRRTVECDYCELAEMNRQGTPFWDGKIRSLLPVPEVRKYCDWNVTYSGAFYGHNPLRAGHRLQGTDAAGVVALFRDPRRRLTSAWNHGKHTHHLGTRDAESRFPNSRSLLEKETPTLKDFARHKHVRGCQVKMLVGGQCGMWHNVSDDVRREAMRRLHALAFVGLTEAYNASVCLFHHMHGGVPQPHMFANARPATAHNTGWKPRRLPGGGMQVRPSAWQTLSADDDPDDWRLFVAARSLFVRRLREHGLLQEPS